MSISKDQVLAECLQLITSKIIDLENSMRELQEAANSETKSSMGDKYETGRAMNQNAKDLLAGQLAEQLKIKTALAKIDLRTVIDQVEFGALVKTDQACYFLAAALGPIQIEKNNVMVISAVSPIGQNMLGKRSGDSFEWRGLKIKIEDIE